MIGRPTENRCSVRRQVKKDVTFIFPENANHVQKYEPKSRSEIVPTEAATGYNASDAHLDEEAEASILKWLAAHA